MQQTLSPIKVLEPRGQCITLLLAAIADLGGSLTKREVIKYIDENRWFAKQPDDWKPYPSQSEPRWHTLIAWGRKDSVLRDIVLNNERDSWVLSPNDRRVWASTLIKFSTNECDVSKGYLWSKKFKIKLCSTYIPRTEEAKRPSRFYQDIWEQELATISY